MRTLLALLLGLASVAAGAAERPAVLTVDAREAPRHILHMTLTLPVSPGALTLRYPKWIPGEHAPTGPVADLAGLMVRAGDKALSWRRDDVDMYSFHVDVPAGVSTLEVRYDYLAPAEQPGFSSGSSMTSQLLALEWNLVTLYPAGVQAAHFLVTPRLVLPHEWKQGTALETAKAHDDTVEYKPVSLETLIDTPVVAGAHFRALPLKVAAGEPPHTLDIVADSDAALQIEPSQLAAVEKLVAEAGALFGARHYDRYHFLLTLSDHVAHFGLEHHRSSDNRVPERSLIDPSLRNLTGQLLPHEFVHSWNGKYRRPAGLVTGGYDQPMKGELLWVYEGLTQYLGWVLAGRSGLQPADWWRDSLAATAAGMEDATGRSWRPLEDTAVAAQTLYGSPVAWSSWRRGVDYYPEGLLLWLEVDVLLRQRSGGKKSIDDFCKAFYGPPSSAPEVKPYALDDVVAALDGVVKYDWRGFFHARVDEVRPHAPLAGVSDGGWRLAYDDKPNLVQQAKAKENKLQLFVDSLGFALKGEEGMVLDVLPSSPAAKAGLAPAMRVVGVDGRKLDGDVIADALKLKKPSIELLVMNSDFYKVLKIDYRGGERWPHVARQAGKADLLEAIARPRTMTLSATK